jgi:hypothetical protein
VPSHFEAATGIYGAVKIHADGKLSCAVAVAAGALSISLDGIRITRDA